MDRTAVRVSFGPVYTVHDDDDDEHVSSLLFDFTFVHLPHLDALVDSVSVD